MCIRDRCVYSEKLKRFYLELIGFRDQTNSVAMLQKNLDMWVMDSQDVWHDEGKTAEYISVEDFEHIGGVIKFQGRTAEIANRDQMDALAQHIQAYIAEEYAARVTDMNTMLMNFK